MNGSPFTLYRRRESGAWYARFRLPDGSWSNPRSTREYRKREAAKWCEEWLRRYGAPATRSSATLAEYASSFFDHGGRWETRYNDTHERPVSASHLRNLRGKLTNYIVPVLGAKRIDQIATADIEYALRWCKEHERSHRGDGRKLSATTINAIRSALSSIFEAAIRDGIVRDNPVRHAFRMSAKGERRGILQADELRALVDLTSTDVWDDERFRLLTALAVFTAGRSSEVRTLHPEDVLRGEVVYRRGWEHATSSEKAYPKNGAARRAPIPPEIEEALRSWIEEQELPPGAYVFPSPDVEGRPVSAKAVRNAFRRALGRMGLSDDEIVARKIVFHSLRHAAATLLMAEGVSEWIVKQLTGHKSAEVFAAYSDHAEGADWTGVRSWQSNMLAKVAAGEAAL